MEQLYSIGQVFRLGLLKNHKGKPYTSKASVSKVISKLKTTKKMTPFGMGTFIHSAEIAKHNKKMQGLL